LGKKTFDFLDNYQSLFLSEVQLPLCFVLMCKVCKTTASLVFSKDREVLSTIYISGSQTFSHHIPFVVLVLSPRTTFLQENSIYQISFDQKFGKPELAQMRHEDNGCEKLQWAFLKPTKEIHKNSGIT